MNTPTDEACIRTVIAECTAGTGAGEFDRVRQHLTDDMMYLLAGEPLLRTPDAFIGLLQGLHAACHVEAVADIRELIIMGDHAYTLNWLTLTLTPRNGGQPRRRSGYTITLLRREASGRWLVFRNANLLTEL